MSAMEKSTNNILPRIRNHLGVPFISVIEGGALIGASGSAELATTFSEGKASLGFEAIGSSGL